VSQRWAELVPFPCQKGGYTHASVQKRDSLSNFTIVLFLDRFQSQAGGGENFPLRDLVCGPVCRAKLVHFWKHAFSPPPECHGPFCVLLAVFPSILV
jgi:hypothetical protein